MTIYDMTESKLTGSKVSLKAGGMWKGVTICIAM